MKNQIIGFGYLVLMIMMSMLYAQTRVGDPGVTFDSSKYDSRYPQMKEWEKAGVEGGIPLRNTLPIITTLTPTNSKGIQNAINQIDTKGKPSVILLKKGVYTIDNPIKLKTNVILRGEKKNEVFLNVTIRSKGSKDEEAFTFDDISKSGLEDLTFEYIPPRQITIFDDRNKPLDRRCGKPCFSNDPEGVTSMYVSFVNMTRNSKNCWIDNCVFKNSGSDPLEIRGDHITCRNNFIDACFNKGSGGNGYYDIRGNYGLYVNERVRRIRHFSIQQKAKYNVVINCDIEVDVNFHNGDNGFNLIENNKITSLEWRAWGAFASGGSRYGHRKPGSNNLVFNNVTKGKNNSERFTGNNKVFVFDQYREPRLLRNSPPSGNTFYPAILGDESGNGCDDTKVIVASEDAYLQSSNSFNNGNLRIESRKRVSYLKFTVPSVKETITGARLELAVSSDSGNGLIEVFKGSSNNWTETNLSDNNKPSEGAKIGSLNTIYSKEQSYQWELSGITPGETVSLIVKQTGGNDVSFSSKEGINSPKLIFDLECEDRQIARSFEHDLDIKSIPFLKIYPNPTKDLITVFGVNSGESIIIYDLFGNTLKKQVSKNQEESLDVSRLKPGLYILTIPGKNRVQFIKE